MAKKDFDVIVIGSGPGGLGAALPLAQAGKKVLVCEQHDRPGGWMHSFTLDGHSFSTGVHYLGELLENQTLFDMYTGLGVSQDMEWAEMNPEAYDHFFFEDIGDFSLPTGQENYKNKLKEHFPHESKGIDKLFKTIDGIWGILLAAIHQKLITGSLPFMKYLPWNVRSAQSLIFKHVKDEKLRSILLAQAGDYAMQPSKASAIGQAGIMKHYMGGCYYPVGGGKVIARAFVRAFKRAYEGKPKEEQGQIRLNTRVSEILVEKKKTTGVRLQNGEVITADIVISNADPYTTFNKMMDRPKLPYLYSRRLKKTTYSASCFSLYLAIDMDLKAAGWHSGNHWLYKFSDIEKVYELCQGDYPAVNEPPVMFTTVPTLKDPSKMKNGIHTMEIFAFTGYDFFKKWENTSADDRPEDYEKAKEAVIENILSVLERHTPGIKDKIIFKELGTPLTNSHYINSHRGNAYQTDKGIFQMGVFGYGNKTPIKNLYLAGGSNAFHGIYFSTLSGIHTASQILGRKYVDLLDQNGPAIPIYPAERPEEWPEKLRKKIEAGRIQKAPVQKVESPVYAASEEESVL